MGRTMRNHFALALAVLLAEFAATGSSLQLVAADQRPNVVILYADDMGVADVSYGDAQAKIQTPNFDRLASSGMTFTDGHSSSGICSPSRFALLTGQDHWRRFHGIANALDGPVFQNDDFTIAKMFKKRGYRTACFGKWHLGWDFDAIRKPDVEKKDWAKAESYLRHFGLDPYGKGHDGLLFNLKEDPRQSMNVYSKHPELVQSMRSLLRRYVNGERCAPTNN